MFHTCNIGVYPTHVLHVQDYMCNTGVYPTSVLHCRNTCVKHMYILHNVMYCMCISYVSATHVIHLYFYTCNTHKTTYMYYRCGKIGHVITPKILFYCANINKHYVNASSLP